MRVLLTGVSSFTGCWFAQALARAGHTVVATLTKPCGAYAETRGRRVASLAGVVTLVPEVRFGSTEFITLMQSRGPFDVLCHHAAEATNYNRLDFDVAAALVSNIAGLPATLETLKRTGGKAVVLTGSVFEASEGAGDEPRRAFNPYGLSKSLTADAFAYYVPAAGLRWGKFVIPNPFGPLEEPRFIAYLFRTWKEGKVAEVKTPDYVRDNIPVDLLAECYRLFVAQVSESSELFSKLNPSGYVETQGAFTLRLAAAMRPRLQRECLVQFAQQTDFSQPLTRVNTDPARLLVPEWQEDLFWDQCADYYRAAYLL